MNKLLCLLPLLALSAFAAAPPPANDDFANRTALVSSGSISIADRNASATTQALEPTIAGDAVSRSVWYSWTAPFTGPVTVSTAGSSFDTLLGIFTGTALGALTSIAENDDAGTGAFTSTVSFNAVSGIPYVILVGGFNGAGGKIRLTITVGAGPCTYGVTPTSRSFSNTAGTGTETITTPTGCSWSAMSNDSFISITTTSTGTGSGTVSYAVTANTALTARVGTMTIAGATVTIDQAAAPACTYALSPSSTNAPATVVTNTVTMTAGAGCTWNATPNGSWITIQSGASGTGSGLITYALAANTNSNQRVGTITAAGQTFAITQAGTITCTYSLNPPSGSGSFPSAGGTSNIVISTISGCAWTASSPVTWVTFSTTNGSGPATVTYSAAANTNTISRSTTLTVAGLPFAITQSGAACSYSILPSSINVAATAGSSTVSVAAGTGCAWTAVANVSWLTITAGTSGTGSGSVVYNIAANLNTVTRAGTITIAGQTFTVNQAAAACIYSITPTAAHYLAAGGPGNIAVTAGTGCAWTAVSGVVWVTVDSGSPGTGSGTVGYTVVANATTTSRTGTITVAGQTFTVTQDGTVPCTYSIAPASASFTSIGGTNSIAVTANPGCTWSASSGATFVTFTPASGSGNGTVVYTVAGNTSSLTRTGTITVAGQTFTVTQTGVACTYAISPTAASYAPLGGSGTATVTATQGCNWTSSSDSSWLAITSGAAGTGNGSVTYSVTNNPTSVARTGRITAAGKLLIVTQSGLACTFTLSSSSVTLDSAGGNGVIGLTASDSPCSWTATSNQSSWLTVSPASGTGNGNVTYTVAATSLGTTRTGILTIGGITGSQTFTVTQTGDTTVPVITLTAPANGTTISNIVTLAATATDNSSVARVEFYRDTAVLIGTVIASPYSLPFQTTNIANGSHTFYARGFDPANNQGLSSTSTVTIANSSAVNTNSWATRFGSAASDQGQAVAIDLPTGDIVMAGIFGGVVDFGGGNITNTSSSDIVLAKYSSAGVHKWSEKLSGTGNGSATSVAIDSSGNIFLTGSFTGSVDFGGGPLVSLGVQDIFLTKYSTLGVYSWAKRFGSTDSDIGYSVAIDPGGNVLLTGTFRGNVSFGGATLISAGTFQTPYFPGSPDVFLAKFTTGGAHTWSENFTNNTAGDEGFSIASDAASNVYVTGYYTGTIDFGGGILPQFGGSDIYLAKFNSAGTYQWANHYGGTGADRGQALAIDASGNVFLSGIYSATGNFGGTSITAAAGFDVFLAKYSTGGALSWVKGFGGANGALPYSVQVDSASNVVVGGYFTSPINVGGTVLSSAGGLDAFIGKFTNAGILSWAKSFGGPVSDLVSGIATDSNNYIAATGAFSGTANFSGTSLTSLGGYDIFLMRLAP